MKKKSLGFNALLNSVKSLLNIIFPLITFPYVSRVLSVRGIGINNFSTTYIGYFVLIAQLGITNYAVREGAKFRNNILKFTNFASQVFSINIFSTLLSYVLLFLSLIIFRSLNNYISCILIYSLQILFTTLGTEWIYITYEDYTYITIRSIVFNILSLVFLLLFVKNSRDYLIYAAISVFATVGSNILNFVNIRSKLRLKFTIKIDWSHHIVPILVLFAANVTSIIYMYCDNTILGIIKGDYAVGIYSISVKIYSICKSLIMAGITVTIPRLAMLYGQKRTKEYNNVLAKVIDSLTIIAMPATIGLVMLSKEVIIIVASKKYLPSVASLQIIAFATLFSLFSYILSSCVLIPAKREKFILLETTIASIVNITLNLLLIPQGSYNAAAFTTVISEFIALSIGAYYSKDIIRDVIHSRKRLENFGASCVGSIAVFIICLLCDWVFKGLLLKTIFSVVISVIIYAIILLSLRNEIAIEIVKRIKTIVKFRV